MVLDLIFRSITVSSLVLALAVFLLRLSVRGRKLKGRGMDFGAPFSGFVAGWIATELMAIFAPAEWTQVNEFLHFGVLALFAIWMNARWRWALRNAEVID